MLELRPYYYKRNLRDTHCDYGVVADSVEKCPIGIVDKIGLACTVHSCCQGNSRFMHIAPNRNSWIMCKETTKKMNADPSAGQQETCVEKFIK